MHIGYFVIAISCIDSVIVFATVYYIFAFTATYSVISFTAVYGIYVGIIAVFFVICII